MFRFFRRTTRPVVRPISRAAIVLLMWSQRYTLALWFRSIRDEAMRCRRIVGNLLDLARTESVRTEPVAVREVLDRVVEIRSYAATAAGIALAVEADPACPPVLGDFHRLVQAVLNLVANAQKFSPVGAEVLLRVGTDDDGCVRWSVIDRGPGIAPEEQDRLFERFFVGTSDRHAAGRGTGIGLPMALAIAQAHGGTIEVDSEVGRGSAFHLVIERGEPAA